MNCPRCNADEQRLRVEYQGSEGAAILWTVFYCPLCGFTWRDSEPGESIDYRQRPAWFRVDPARPEQYKHNIPPAREDE